MGNLGKPIKEPIHNEIWNNPVEHTNQVDPDFYWAMRLKIQVAISVGLLSLCEKLKRELETGYE